MNEWQCVVCCNGRSELGAVAALLAAHLHAGDVEDEGAVGVGHSVPADDPQYGDPPGHPRVGLHLHGAALDVLDELRQISREAVGLHGERERDVAVAAGGDAARVDPRLADLGAAVEQRRAAVGAVGEGGGVGVVHGDGEEQRDVELQREGREREARGHAGQARGDEARGGVPHAQDGQGEDQDGEGEDEEQGERGEGAGAEAAPAPAGGVRWREGLGGGGGVGGEDGAVGGGGGGHWGSGGLLVACVRAFGNWGRRRVRRGNRRWWF
ncbi:hypothetical protein BS78_05G018400 [Paspalum vaginatum]|nr:hypothetical protein BS78_05G018400 [Paspalum vaginatum]